MMGLVHAEKGGGSAKSDPAVISAMSVMNIMKTPERRGSNNPTAKIA